MVGIGLQSVGLAKSNSLVPYHFFLIWMLALLSTATHNAALLALVQDFKRDWVLRWMRQLLMFVNLALSCVYGIYVLQSKVKGLPTTLPVGCVWELDSTTSNVGGLDYVGTIVTIAGNCVVFGLATWYLQSRNQRFYKAVQVVGLVLMSAIAIGTSIPPSLSVYPWFDASQRGVLTTKLPHRGNRPCLSALPSIWEPRRATQRPRREGMEFWTAAVPPDAPSPRDLRDRDHARRDSRRASSARRGQAGLVWWRAF